MNWNFPNHSSVYSYLLGGLPILIITIIFMPRSLHDFRRKNVTLLLSGHSCPQCGYSLIGLHCREDGFTLCPECGVVWQLPERVIKISSHSYRFEFVAACLIILLFTVYIIWSIELGNPIFSSMHMVVFYAMILGIFVTSIRWINSKKNRPRLVIPNYHELQRGNCPACHVVIDGVPANWEGVTTCTECGTVWKIPEGELEGVLSEPSKFARNYWIPTWVVDGDGKSVLRLRPKDQWMGFITSSLIKLRCPSCQHSLSNSAMDGEGLTRCPECGASWILPSEEEIRYYTNIDDK